MESASDFAIPISVSLVTKLTINFVAMTFGSGLCSANTSLLWGRVSLSQFLVGRMPLWDVYLVFPWFIMSDVEITCIMPAARSPCRGLGAGHLVTKLAANFIASIWRCRS